MKLIESIKNWFLGLGDEYGVDPLIFGAIYVGAIPFFTISVGWLVRNLRKGQSIILPAMSSGLFFISAYLYLIIAGRNVPWWVYAIILAMVTFGVYSTVHKIRQKVN